MCMKQKKKIKVMTVAFTKIQKQVENRLMYPTHNGVSREAIKRMNESVIL